MSDTITNELARWVEARDLSERGAIWQRLGPTRTNLVWRVTGAGGNPVVVKLFAPTRSTPLFPNDADAEWRALDVLQGSGLAPAPIARATTPWGPIILSTFVPSAGEPGPHALGAGLRDLHGRDPLHELRRLALDGPALIATGHAMLDDCDVDRAARLTALAPEPPAPEGPGRASFLHGDPVASNVLAKDGRAVFVDWQCPASGDPVFDIACALSPSMRLSCGRTPFSESEIDAVLRGYGDEETGGRYRRWSAVFAWRFACYAAWCGANGREGRASGFRAEIALLERLGQ
ncbi:aminoglycoside phosphotransferase family protein [Maribius pontilimi]|uniref:Aminoglycoside phosphotransferase family protein n=1 Tax=Palleronia pontilimi TaxID=1964209 RepID=A0A934IIF8_9RHOB|nr:aminoglycoside phosphotransferase family protein [Palleronia pontilimi]